jgi:hypothetical protein
MDWKQLLASTTRSVDEELRLRNAYRVAENRSLRHQLPGRVRLTDSERTILAGIGQQLGKKALEEIATIAKADTILAWRRKLAVQTGDTSKPRPSVGRLRIDKDIEDLVVRMARENRSWGYDRIAGALKHLGYTVSDQTVGNILKRHGIPTAPARKKTMTWKEFIRIHLDVLGATEFFTTQTWSWLGMLISSLLFFISVSRRKGEVGGCTPSLRKQLILLIPKQSLDLQVPRERGSHVVEQMGRLRLIGRGAEVRRHPLPALSCHDHREHQPRGRGKVVCMPVVSPRLIRDRPTRGRQRCCRLLLDDNHAAA